MRFAPAAGGAVLGLALAGMHYAGMLAYRVEGLVQWNLGYVAASVVIGVVLSALAIHLAADRQIRHGRYFAIASLVAAIVGLHFTGMTALRVQPLLIDDAATASISLRRSRSPSPAWRCWSSAWRRELMIEDRVRPIRASGCAAWRSTTISPDCRTAPVSTST